jgi:hypothetical protein
MRTN